MEHVPGSPSRSRLTSPASPLRFFSCLRFETRRRVAVPHGSLGSSHADCPITVTDGGPRVATLLSFPVPFLSTYAIWQRYDRTFWGILLRHIHSPPWSGALSWTWLPFTAVVFSTSGSPTGWELDSVNDLKGFQLQTTAFRCHSDPKERWKRSVHTYGRTQNVGICVY